VLTEVSIANDFLPSETDVEVILQTLTTVTLIKTPYMVKGNQPILIILISMNYFLTLRLH